MIQYIKNVFKALYTQLNDAYLCIFSERLTSFCYRVCFIMKWTTQHDIEFCKEVVASKLFETKKRSAESAKVWEDIANNLKKMEYPKTG